MSPHSIIRIRIGKRGFSREKETIQHFLLFFFFFFSFSIAHLFVREGATTLVLLHVRRKQSDIFIWALESQVSRLPRWWWNRGAISRSSMSGSPSAGISEKRRASWDDLNPADSKQKSQFFCLFVFSLFLCIFLLFLTLWMYTLFWYLYVFSNNVIYFQLFYFILFCFFSCYRVPGHVHCEISHSALFISRLTPTRKPRWPMKMATIHHSHC